ncbi:MAG: hypothetical protein AB1631_10105 [Acidobacteriota bacterium]
MHILMVVGFFLLGFASFAGSLTAQPLPQVEVLSHRVVESISGFDSNWRATDPTNYKGIVLSLKVSFTPEIKDISSSDFTLTYKSKMETQKALCVGITLPSDTPPTPDEGFWILNDLKEGRAYSLKVENMKCCAIYSRFLFAPLPNDTNEVTLMYKDKIMGKSVRIKR